MEQLNWQPMILKARELREKCAEGISDVANEIMTDAANYVQRVAPDWWFTIFFLEGEKTEVFIAENGGKAYSIDVDDFELFLRSEHVYPQTMKELLVLVKAIRAVRDITDNYQLGCPVSVRVLENGKGNGNGNKRA